MIQRFLVLHSPVVKGLSSLFQNTASGRNCRLLNTCTQWQSVTTVRKLHQSSEEKRWEEVRIPVPWGHIAGKWWGPQDVQPILALHGWQDNASTFDPLMARLPPTVSVLAIDMPGHGRSSHYPAGCMYHFTEDIVTIRRIVRQKKWQNVTLMGHSMGGSYAFLYAAIFPMQVKKLLTFDIIRPFVVPSDYFVTSGGKIVDKFLDAENKSLSPEYTPTEIFERQFKATKGSISKQAFQVLLARNTYQSKNKAGLLHLSRDVRLKYAIFLQSFPHEFLLEFASKVKCEVLNVKAKPGAYYEKKEYYQQTLEVLRKSAKKLTYCEMSGTHHAHLNSPENVPDIVIEFLCTANS